MICAYGPYSASATGGNGWARDFLAGVLTVPATPFYQNIGGAKHLEIASTILFCISIILVLAVYVIYFYGPTLRRNSPFAESLSAASSDDSQGHRHPPSKMEKGSTTKKPGHTDASAENRYIKRVDARQGVFDLDSRVMGNGSGSGSGSGDDPGEQVPATVDVAEEPVGVVQERLRRSWSTARSSRAGSPTNEVRISAAGSSPRQSVQVDRR